MIVIQQSDDVILIFNEAKFPDDAFKLIKFQVMYIFSSQSLHNLLEVEPPEKQISKFHSNLFSQFFQSWRNLAAALIKYETLETF